MTTVNGRLEDHARRRAAKVFCEFHAGAAHETITFGQLYERSLAYARSYRAHGVRAGDVVIIILKHSPHLFYSYLGAMLAGAVPSFMPFPSPKQRADLYWRDHQALFERIRPAMLVTYASNAEAARSELHQFATPVLIASDEILHEACDTQPFEQPRPDEIACLQHSSGTTSLKKGVMLSHAAILNEVRAYAASLAFAESDVIASWLPLYHDMGFVACFMTSVVAGTTLVALDPFEWVVRPHLLLDAIERYSATFCWLPNFAFVHLANAAKPGRAWNLSSMRAFINCSEPCKQAAFEKFLARFEPCGVRREHLQVCYAMAENVFAVTQTPLGAPVRTLDLDIHEFAEGRVAPREDGAPAVTVLSCGFPVEGVSVCIGAGAHPQNTIGEVRIRGDFLFSGYHRLPEKTAEKLRDGWYSSGDLGFMNGGELFVTGRVDDMLIIAGRNYYAHEIEAVVNGVPAVIPGRNVALAVEDHNTGAMAVAVLAECEAGADLADIGKRVRQDVLEKLGLAVHEVVPIERGGLIKTTSGKISRGKNLELYLERAR